jgi:hypothetical protein
MATVNEMIHMLTDLQNAGHGEYQVHSQYNYGDHSRTQVAPGSGDDLELGFVYDHPGFDLPAILDEDQIEQLKRDYRKEDPEVDVHSINDDGTTQLEYYGRPVMQVVLIG